MKIITVHLYNDYSGSPLILANIIRGWTNLNYDVQVMTSANQEGFLSDLEVKYNNFAYRFSENRLLRLLLYLATQLSLFFRLLMSPISKGTIIYINTLLPFGAALAGKIKGLQVVYHIHETSVRPLILKGFLKLIAKHTACKVIYVSNYLKSVESLGLKNEFVVHNSLSNKFKEDALQQIDFLTDSSFTVLMLCSLKAYKGVNEFVLLAKRLPEMSFQLVLNTSSKHIKDYFKNTSLPENLILYPVQRNVHPFYQKAGLLINLSHPERWVESFGMTILEGLHYGLPAIAPPIGGPSELIKNGENGYLIDKNDLEGIENIIHLLATNKQQYQKLSNNAKLVAASFSYEKMLKDICQLLVRS